MSLDRPTRFICLRQTDRSSEDRLRDKRRSSHTIKIKNLYDNVYLAFLGENLLKLLFDAIQLIGSTRPQFDVWPNPN